jgi:membrane protein DedA with SNARE-associated domain
MLGIGREPYLPGLLATLGAVLLTLASVTEQLTNSATDIVSDGGFWGIFALMLLESACIPIPAETTMLFAGFGVATGQFSLIEITAAGVLGNLVGSWIAYGVGYYGRRELLERHGKWFHLTPAKLDRADRWFDRYGSMTVLVSRLLPAIRSFISLPAGAARMPFMRFSVLTAIGCIPFVFVLGLIGDLTKHNWKDVKSVFSYADYLFLAAIVFGIVYLVIRARRGPGSGGAESPADAPA